jgi:uracil-DNA glycosylase
VGHIERRPLVGRSGDRLEAEVVAGWRPEWRPLGGRRGGRLEARAEAVLRLERRPFGGWKGAQLDTGAKATVVGSDGQWRLVPMPMVAWRGVVGCQRDSPGGVHGCVLEDRAEAPKTHCNREPWW